jgi:DHA2 family multidrug resistance protein-like MFS transporter
MSALVSIGQAFPGVAGIGEWTLLIYTMTAASLSILAGVLGDKYGLRKMYTVGLFIFLLGAFGASLAKSGEALLLFRSISGVGSAVLAPVALAFLNRIFDRTEKPIAFGYWAASITIGSVVGPILGGWIQDIWSWRLTFPIAALPALIALAFVGNLPAYKPDQKSKAIDTKGIAYLSALPAIVLFTLAMAGRLNPSSIIISLTIIVLGSFSFWKHLKTTESPVIDLQILENYKWWRPSMIQLIIRCLFMAMLILLTGYFHSIQGLSELNSSSALFPFLISVGVMAFTSGYICKSIGIRKLMTTMFSLGLAGAVILLSVQPDGFRLIDWIAICFIGLLAGSTSQLSRLSMANFGVNDSMKGASINTLIINVGISIGAAYPTLIRSIVSKQAHLSNIISKENLLHIMHEEVMVLILLFCIGIWQAGKLQDLTEPKPLGT